VSKAFIGTYALSLEHGLSTTDASEAFTKTLAIERATKVIVLADSRKIGTTSFAGAGRLDQVDVLVTDAAIDDHVARELQKRGIAVFKA
jgi:DeoR family fructose operon transcriptional repressor